MKTRSFVLSTNDAMRVAVVLIRDGIQFGHTPLFGQESKLVVDATLERGPRLVMRTCPKAEEVAP